jgi:hypothetical protein
MIGEDGEVYLIDFGKSSVPTADSSVRGGDVYEIDEARSYLNDNWILEICQKLEADAWKNVPEKLRTLISEKTIDDNTGYQLRNAREIIEQRELEVTPKVVGNIIRNLQAALNDEDKLGNEAVALMNMAKWDDISEQAVKTYLNEKLEEKDLDTTVRSVYEKVLGQI